jgi:uroporphyrinogen-III decarboxylase
VFSLGAKMENLPLDAFLGNATKISNSMRQIRSHLGSDGVACYFHPYLEAEALGGVLEWNTESQRPTIGWPRHAEKGELPEDLRGPDEAMKRGRVGVAIEVIRRLKSLLRDDPLLTAGVAGPFTLAARITQLDHEPLDRLPEAALEAAAAMMTRLSAAFAEAGANMIFIQEAGLPRLSAESCETWASRLAPALNIIRFYQALPVLQLTGSRSFAENSEVILQQHWDCVVCPTMEFPPATEVSQSGDVLRGVALPPETLLPEKAGDREVDTVLDYVMSELRPAIVTTAGDVPVGTDMKRLMRISERIRSYDPRQPGGS